MILRSLFFVALLLSLSACVGNSAPTDTESAEFKNATTIQAYSKRDGLNTWVELRLLSVDDQYIKYGTFDGAGKTFVISPGNNTVAVEVSASAGYRSVCPCKGIEVIKFVSKPGHSYRVRAELDGDEADLWIEDLATNAPVTEVMRLRPREESS